MMMKTVAAGLAGSLLFASAAFAAETSDTSTTTTTTRANTTDASYQGNWRGSKLVGLKVYNDNNENVGSINDMLVDKNGTIKVVVIGVGGFLGMGEHLVAVSFDKMRFSDQPVAYSSASNTPASGTSSTTPSSTTTTGSAAGTSSSSSSKWYPDHAVFNASKDELTSMPEFKYSE
jgi:sporulation protein YlmC with PRC-barrel domain